MHFSFDKLHHHIKKGKFAPIYLISGDEPLQTLEAADLIRYHALQQGYSRKLFNVDKNFSWNEITQTSKNLSLFSDRQLIEIRMNNLKPGREGGQVLQDYANTIDPDNLLLITSSKLDKKTQTTKWYKALDKAGITVSVWQIPIYQLPQWIQNRATIFNKTISQDAATIIAESVEGNLLAARQELEKIALLVEGQNIDGDHVMNTITDSSRYNAFDLMAAAFMGDAKRVQRMLHSMQAEGIEPLMLFGAIMWELRRVITISFLQQSGQNLSYIFKNMRVWQQQQAIIKNALDRHSLQRLQHFLKYTAIIDRVLKSRKRPQAWDKINHLLLAIAGYDTKLMNYERH